MRSSIAWALLGLVIERPSYGYELQQRFKRTYDDTLGLSSPAKIYTALEALSVRSLIEDVGEEPDPRATRLPKPRYRVTEQGVRAYQDWLLMQLAEARQRERLFARQLAMLEPQAALGVIDQYESECLQENDVPEEAETDRQGVATRLAEEEEHLALQVRLSWIEFARGELRALLEEREEGGEKA
jgi:DNA-binding PadR family transcriptional regulator